jgi:hypothetical protein
MHAHHCSLGQCIGVKRGRAARSANYNAHVVALPQVVVLPLIGAHMEDPHLL